MVFSYFPGCTLKTKGKALDISARACAEALGFTLEELPDWQCCGAAYTSAKDELLRLQSEMERRYELLIKNGVRKIDYYNELAESDPSMGERLPEIVVVIDELSGILGCKYTEVGKTLVSIAQKARAAGIHLLVATQNIGSPSMPDGLLTALPTHACYKAAKRSAAKALFGSSGAEKLLDRGDMLFFTPQAFEPCRIQTAYIGASDIARITAHLRNTYGAGYDGDATAQIDATVQKWRTAESEDGDVISINNEQFVEAVEIAMSTGKISTSLLQRKLCIGYGKAAQYIVLMEELGIIEDTASPRPKEVIITPEKWRMMLEDGVTKK